jgi:DNA polymerase II large subunit
MRYQINGYTDMYTVIANERKVGGAIEASTIRLRSGEVYANAVLTRLEMSGTHFCSIGFVTEDGKRLIVHVNDISMVADARHVDVRELNNDLMREEKTAERLKRLKRLCELNEGSCTLTFQEEATLLVQDIGLEVARAHVDLAFLPSQEKTRVVRIA